MPEFEGRTFSDGAVEYTIHEHIAVLDDRRGWDMPWRREVNLVSWNGGPPKIDIREWSESHDRMTRGITLTEEQAMKMTKALVDRYRARSAQEHSTPMREDYAR